MNSKTNNGQPEVGTPLGGVAECSYHMGTTHRITRSGGAFQTLSEVSSAITGRDSDFGPDTTTCGRDRIQVVSCRPCPPFWSALWLVVI